MYIMDKKMDFVVLKYPLSLKLQVIFTKILLIADNNYETEHVNNVKLNYLNLDV